MAESLCSSNVSDWITVSNYPGSISVCPNQVKSMPVSFTITCNQSQCPGFGYCIASSTGYCSSRTGVSVPCINKNDPNLSGSIPQLSNGQSTQITVYLPPSALSPGSSVKYYLVIYGAAVFNPMNIPITVNVSQYSVSLSPSQLAYVTTNPNSPLQVRVTVSFGACPPPTPLYIYDNYGNTLATVTGAGTYTITITPSNYGCTTSSTAGRCATVTLYIGPNTSTSYASTTFYINYQPPQQCPLSGVTNQSFQSVLSNGCWNCSQNIAGNPFPIQICSGQSLTTTVGIPSPQCTGAYYLNMYLCTSTPCTNNNAFFTSSNFYCGASINYFSITIPASAVTSGNIYVTLTDSCGNSVTGAIPVSAINPNYSLATNILVNGVNIAQNPNVTVSPGGTVTINAGVALKVASQACISSQGYTVNLSVTSSSGTVACTQTGTVYPQYVAPGQSPIYTSLACNFTAPSTPGSYSYTITASIPALNLTNTSPLTLIVGQAQVSVSNINVTTSPGASCSQSTGNTWVCQGLLGTTIQVSMTLTNTGTYSWIGSVAVYDQSGTQLASTGTLTLTSGSSQQITLNATIPTTYAVGSPYTWYVVVNGACSNCTSQTVPYDGTVNVVAILYVTPGGAVSFTASNVPTSIIAVSGQSASLSFTLTCNPQTGQTCPSGVNVQVIDTANNAVLASGSFTASQLAGVPYATYNVSLTWTANVPNIPGNTSCFTPTIQPQCGGQQALYASCLSVTAYSSTNNAKVWSVTLPYIICPTAVKGAITASLSTNSVFFIQGGYNTYQNVFVYLNNTTSNNVSVTCALTTSGGSVANICFGGAGVYNAPCQFTTTVSANSNAMGMFQVAYSQSTFPSAGQYTYTLSCNCGQNCTVGISNPNLVITVSPIAFTVVGPNNCTFSTAYLGLVGTCSISNVTVNTSFTVPIRVIISMAPPNSSIGVSVTLYDQNNNTVATYSTTWCNYSGSGCNVVNQPVNVQLNATAPSTPGTYQWSASVVLTMSGQTVGNVRLPIIITVVPQITFTYGFVLVPTNTVSGPNGTSQILTLVLGCNCQQPTQFQLSLYNKPGQLIAQLTTPAVGPNAPGNTQCPSQAGSFCTQYSYYTVVPISVALPSLFELLIIRGIPQSTLVSNYTTYGYLWSEPYSVVVTPILSS